MGAAGYLIGVCVYLDVLSFFFLGGEGITKNTGNLPMCTTIVAFSLFPLRVNSSCAFCS